jgi:hypothetical protein
MAFSAPRPRWRRVRALLFGVAGILLVATAGRWWPNQARALAGDASTRASLSMRMGGVPLALPKRTLTAERAIVTERAFGLFESDAVINVVPQAFLDPVGGFLVTDEREGQLRSYAPDGALRWHTGRIGDGPGEFRLIAGAARLGNGEVAAVDRNGRITVFDAEGKTVLHTVETGLSQVTDVAAVHDSLLLVAGVMEGRRRGPRLHLLHPRTGEPLRRFFAPFAGSPNQAAATVAGFTRFALRGDTLAATFGVSDTVYVFTAAGEPVRQFPLLADSLRRVPLRAPSAGTQMERFSWLTTFDLVADVHWLPDGIVVAYQSVLPGTAFERQWHLVTMTPAGQPRLEVPRVPPLLAVDPERGTFYFLDPDSETPDRWIEARLRG